MALNFSFTIILLAIGCGLCWHYGRKNGSKHGEIIAFKKTAYWVARARENEKDSNAKVRAKEAMIRGLEGKIVSLNHEITAWKTISKEEHPETAVEDMAKRYEEYLEKLCQPRYPQNYPNHPGMMGNMYNQMMGASTQTFSQGLFPWWPFQ